MFRFHRESFDASLRPYMEVYFEMERNDPDFVNVPIPAVAVLHLLFFEGDLPFHTQKAHTFEIMPKVAFTGMVDCSFKVARFKGHVNNYGITFTPLGLYHLLGIKPSRILNLAIEYDKICYKPLPDLFKFPNGKKGSQQRWEVVRTWCDDLIRSQSQDLSNVEKLIFDIRESLGKVRILSLIEKKITRNLQRQFKDIMGMTPKHYARLLRFNSAMAWLGSNPKISLLEAAVKTGYYDVAHLCHDFKELSAPLPGQWTKDPQAHTANLIDPLK